MNSHALLLTKIRWCIAIIVFGLVIGGATAIPLQPELDWVTRLLGPERSDGFSVWLRRVRDGLNDTYPRYPFIAYGTYWLAFGHFIIALVFLWAWKDPVRYSGLFTFAMVSCALLVPWALILGHFRQIPWGWRLIDCSFGIFGFIPVWLAHCYTKQLATFAKPGVAEPVKL